MTEEEVTEITEEDKVVQWRLYELCQAGFPFRIAESLAERVDIDLHVAIGLLEKGAKPKVVWRILR